MFRALICGFPRWLSEVPEGLPQCRRYTIQSPTTASPTDQQRRARWTICLPSRRLARVAFALYARRKLIQSGDWSLERGKEKLTPWQDGVRSSPRVLVLGAYAALHVRGGTLEIEHGPHDDRVTIRIDIDAEPKPRAILFDSHGEFMTGEAIRWCARYSISLALPGGPGRLITMIESALETKANTMTRMRDIDSSILGAQCAADPVKIAREIVRAKIDAELNATTPDAKERRREFEEWDIKLNSARSVAEIMIVESRAAASYWRTFRASGLRERKNGNLPRSWLRFAQRNKGAAFLGNQHASHPINAMLNYASSSQRTPQPRHGATLDQTLLAIARSGLMWPALADAGLRP